MQYKNPTDNELVFAAEEAYQALTRLSEVLDTDSEKWHIAVRLRDAIFTAKAEMQAQEEMDKEDFLTTSRPPSSMD